VEPIATEGLHPVEPSDSNSNSSSDSDEVLVEGHPTTSQFHRPAIRKLYANALNSWVDYKYDSPECKHLDITKDWVMSPKVMSNIARHTGLTTLQALASLQPRWLNLERWGAEVLQVLAEVTAEIDAQAELKRLEAEERRLVHKKKACEAQERRDQEEAERQRRRDEALKASQTVVVPKKRRRPLPAGASKEQIQAQRDEIATEKRQSQQQSYWLGRAQEHIQKKAKSNLTDMPETAQAGPLGHPIVFTPPHTALLFQEYSAVPETPQAGPSRLSVASGSINQHTSTLLAKEELIGNQDRLLSSGNTGETSHSLSIIQSHPTQHPTMPSTPHNPQTFKFEIHTLEDMQNQSQQLASTSLPRGRPKRLKKTLPQTKPTPPTPSVSPQVSAKSKEQE
jgi:hypothetical protein